MPLVLLGQPGAGKSLFTQMLAAELDPRDFMVVRVELRAVASDADIQRQIETALAGLTGRSVSWPDLVDDAGRAQPVILLDGFDELLQASGVGQFDFLERVQAFQLREAELRRPVAVVVTSRTAVADQVRYPDGTVVIRLEEFEDHQVGRWLTTWNQANPVRALPLPAALAQGELARQPLLLFVLALFHSGGGDLTSDIGRAQLYERLFVMFAERDVTKHHTQLSNRDRRLAVEHELDLLSKVAFAMFNRGRQVVTDTELRADLDALTAGNRSPAAASQPGRPLDIVEKLAGQFFFKLFMQQAQAMYGHQTQCSAYEFLHTSFGEFLIGRWVVRKLTELAEMARRGADQLHPSPPDDDLLHALLSMAVLSTREQRVLAFVSELLAAKTPDQLTELRTLLTTLFRGCLQPRLPGRFDNYKPASHTAPGRYAIYSANLLLLLVLIAEAEGKISGRPERAGLTLSELYGLDSDTAALDQQRDRWHSTTRLWYAQLAANEWDSLVNFIRLTQTEGAMDAPQGLRVNRWRSLYYSLEFSGRAMLGLPPDPILDTQLEFDGPAGRAVREAALLGCAGYRNMCTTLLPYQRQLGLIDYAAPAVSGDLAANVINLLVAPARNIPSEERLQYYVRIFDSSVGMLVSRSVLDQLRRDVRELSLTDLATIMPIIRRRAWTNITAYLDILAYINSAIHTNEHVPRDLRGLLDLRGVLDLRGLLGGLDLRDLRGGLDLSGLRGRIGPRNRLDRLGLRDLLGRLDSRGLRGLLSRLSGPLLLLAVWAGMAERGIPVAEPPRMSSLGVALEELISVIPEFVERARRLAAERGFRDPFSVDPDPDSSG